MTRIVRHQARVPLGAAVEAYRLSQARGRHPRRRGRPDVRRRLRRRRHQGFRRALRGRPPSFPVHSLAGGRGRDGRPSRLHPRADGGRRARPRHEARLGRGRSLEHRQSAYPCPGPRPRRRRRRTWSSAATTSARDFATAPPSASHWSWARAASRKSAPRWRRKSRRSAGPASIARSATSPMKAAASSTCAPAATAKTRSYAG